MKKRVSLLFLLTYLSIAGPLSAQDTAASTKEIKVTKLFASTDPLPIKMEYSNRDLRKNTNDSTYILSSLQYQDEDGRWETLDVKIRARGNFRREHCYFPPVKIKIKKAIAKSTLFQGNKELKLVLPCQLVKHNQDYVLKEYLAYKMYEKITPFHFKTRRVAITLTEQRGKKTKIHEFEGFLIEDIDKVAKRHEAKKIKRSVHPLEQDNICSVQNDFFQYMIGNTDFSVAYQHNEKLIFVNERKAIPVPYDFDMSGLVNTNYSLVSQVQDEQLSIEKVTQRLFRGFKRNDVVFEKIRQEFLTKKPALFEVLDEMASEFQDPKQYETARKFLADFFTVLANEKKYRSEILAVARVK